MSAKKQHFFHHIPREFAQFFDLVKVIASDIIYTYKRFFSWNLSKISFVGMSLIYGILGFLPFLFGMLLLAWADPIEWGEILRTGSLLGAMSDATSALWVVPMGIMFLLGFGVFFLISSFYIIFIIRMYLRYIHRKNHSIRSSLSFGPKQFLTFLNISVINFLVIFFPVVLWILFTALLQNMFPSLEGFLLSFLRFLQVIVILFVIYFAYKTQFSYIVLAEKKEKKSAFSIVKKSWKHAKVRSFFPFLGIALLYFMIQLPFQSIDSAFQNKIRENTLMYNFKNDLLTDMTQSDRDYLNFIAQDYEGIGNSQLLGNIQNMYNMRILHFIIMYFVFGSLYILIVTSFYTHCLRAEKK